MKSQPAAALYESNQQAIGAWKRFANGSPKGDVREMQGVACAFANVPLPFFNVALFAEPVADAADLDRRLASAVEYGSASGVPWMFFACREWLPPVSTESADEAFERHRLHRAMALTGMVAELSSLAPPSSDSAGLEYRRVGSRDTLLSISDMNCAAYGIPLEVGRASILDGMFGSDAFAYVGYLNGEPVTAAGTWLVDAVLYVAMVATHPDHRRRGYADAVMRHSLVEASHATGALRTVLHATEAGLPVYERMGYRSVAQFIAYAEPHE